MAGLSDSTKDELKLDDGRAGPKWVEENKISQLNGGAKLANWVQPKERISTNSGLAQVVAGSNCILLLVN